MLPPHTLECAGKALEDLSLVASVSIKKRLSPSK